jgi:hypothetical protein
MKMAMMITMMMTMMMTNLKKEKNANHYFPAIMNLMAGIV